MEKTNLALQLICIHTQETFFRIVFDYVNLYKVKMQNTLFYKEYSHILLYIIIYIIL